MSGPADRIALQRQGAAELVQRARNYDQNAMAILKEMADNAARGDAVAQSALVQVKAYITAHPAEATSEGSPPSEDVAYCLGILKDPRNAPQNVLKALATLPAAGTEEDVSTACAILAVGPPITDELITALLEAAGPWRPTVLYGFQCAGDKARLAEMNREVTPRGGAGHLCAGHCLGMARRIQEAAAGNVAAIGADVAWELGCC
jgi:hypothetical protein